VQRRAHVLLEGRGVQAAQRSAVEYFQYGGGNVLRRVQHQLQAAWCRMLLEGKGQIMRGLHGKGEALLVCYLLAVLAGCGDATKEAAGRRPTTQTLPERITLELAALRDDGGAIVIQGTTNLPEGLKLWIDVDYGKMRIAQDSETYVQNGSFRSAGFTASEEPLPAGKYTVRVLAYFNENWQSPRVLQLVGRGGSKLKGHLFKLDDPELIDSDRRLDYTQSFILPPLDHVKVRELQAVGIVKKAVLVVDGRASAENVERSIADFMRSPELRVNKGWSAERIGGNSYRVTFDFINGKLGADQALWLVDLDTRNVKYLNKNAKYFSWTPKY